MDEFTSKTFYNFIFDEQILGLDICGATIVGDEMARGIPGGQKRNQWWKEPMLILIPFSLSLDTLHQILKGALTFTGALDPLSEAVAKPKDILDSFRNIEFCFLLHHRMQSLYVSSMVRGSRIQLMRAGQRYVFGNYHNKQRRLLIQPKGSVRKPSAPMVDSDSICSSSASKKPKRKHEESFGTSC
ncbi:hypothetical protein FRX31_027239 [Thalictrum thalictroides]|uniref:Uncharacterized protein n=1 Tax=Thalictrum thalictroides TaxID=46969 RepID=A0A7J6VG30_THATH|nr:hypothetical protein FRX31_027239 [Thalictrum thalictroides]